MSVPKFGPGDKVFAKMRGYPAWPSKVEGLADWTPGKTKYHIYFYGTKQIAVCREDELCFYVENKSKLGKPKKYKGFNQAISQIDSELGLNVETVSSFNQSQVEGDNFPDGDDNCNRSDSSESEQIALLPQFEFQTCKPSSSRSRPNANLGQLSENAGKLISVLKIESQLLDLDYGIQTSLNIKKADPEACLTHLNKMLELDTKALMLKKHPEILDTIIKLQMYVGNAQQWDMPEKEYQAFTYNANKIKIRAKDVFNKFKSLFNVPYEQDFFKYFNEEMKEFISCTKHLTQDEVIRLVDDPTETTLPQNSQDNNDCDNASKNKCPS